MVLEPAPQLLSLEQIVRGRLVHGLADENQKKQRFAKKGPTCRNPRGGSAAKSMKVVDNLNNGAQLRPLSRETKLKCQEEGQLGRPPGRLRVTAFSRHVVPYPRRLPIQEHAVRDMPDNWPHQTSLPRSWLEWRTVKPAAATATKFQSGIQRNHIPS
ncbi:hypothetical protein MTO96_032676 [Rhipicephalus appendiculatus]